MAFEKNEVKNIKVTVRFSEEEKVLIDNYIAANNYRNVTELIRAAISEKINH